MPECWLLSYGFRPGVYQRGAGLQFLVPGRNKAPTDHVEPILVVSTLAHYQDALGRGNVEPWRGWEHRNLSAENLGEEFRGKLEGESSTHKLHPIIFSPCAKTPSRKTLKLEGFWSSNLLLSPTIGISEESAWSTDIPKSVTQR